MLNAPHAPHAFRPFRRPAALILTSLTLAAGTSGICSAQPADSKLVNEDRLARPSDTRNLRPVVELASEPVRLESVALTFYPPANARVQTTSVGGSSSIEIYPDNASKDNAWYMVIKAPRVSGERTAAQEADGALVDLIAANGLVFDAAKGIKGPQIKEMWEKNQIKNLGNFLGFQGLVQSRNRELEFEGFPSKAEQFFLSLPSGANQEPLMRGLTVVKVGPDRFVTFELFTTKPYFEQAKDIYTVLLHAAKIGDPAAIARQRGDAITAGIGLFDTLTAQDFDAIISAYGERWERRYKPAASSDPGDATELGYRCIKVWKGKRGELDPDRKIKTFTDLESQEGYLVRIDARLIEGKDLIDSRSMFFVSPDRAEESWSIGLGVQGMDRTNRRSYSEIGVRSGKNLSVTVAGTGNPGITSKPVIESAGYISRVDSYLLPQILVRTGLQGDFGFYVFQSDTGNIKMRRDVISQPSDRPDCWTLQTRLSEDGKLQTSTYTSQGVLLSSSLPDGSVWEPTDIRRLETLWKTKGLPMN